MTARSLCTRLVAAVFLTVALTCSKPAAGQVEVGSTSVPVRISTSDAKQLNPPEGHSPMVALRWSLLPGAGQVYNHQAWKIPIIYGAFAATGYFIYDNYKSMVMFREEYLTRVNEGEARLAGYENYQNSSIYNLYESYNRYFQLSIIVAVGIYALNLVDAYVFGHLFDFQIDDSLVLALSPQILQHCAGFTPGLGVTMSF